MIYNFSKQSDELVQELPINASTSVNPSSRYCFLFYGYLICDFSSQDDIIFEKEVLANNQPSFVHPLQLDVQSIIGNAKTNQQAEQALRDRLLMNKQKKGKPTENEESSEQPNDFVDETIVEPLSKIHALSTNLPAHTKLGSLEDAVKNPLIGIKSYRLFCLKFLR